MNMRSSGRLGLSILFVWLVGIGAIAAATDAEMRRDAQHRLNISGRQRMLSQRMAKAACFAALRPGSAENIREMKEAQALFISSMLALKSGSAEMGLAPQDDADVLSVIDTAAQLAQQYMSAIDEFSAAIAQGPAPEKLQKIYELSLPVLTAVNDAVELLESKHKDGHLIRRGLATALNVSGRQRMLSQKMSKELCMIASGYKPQEVRSHMLGTIALFASSHEELKRGIIQMRLDQKDASALSTKLAEIEQLWRDLRKIFSLTAEGEIPSAEDVNTVANTNVAFLTKLNQAVELYEKIDIPDGIVH
jgi:hypothetical protein